MDPLPESLAERIDEFLRGFRSHVPEDVVEVDWMAQEELSSLRTEFLAESPRAQEVERCSGKKLVRRRSLSRISTSSLFPCKNETEYSEPVAEESKKEKVDETTSAEDQHGARDEQNEDGSGEMDPVVSEVVLRPSKRGQRASKVDRALCRLSLNDLQQKEEEGGQQQQQQEEEKQAANPPHSPRISSGLSKRWPSEHIVNPRRKVVSMEMDSGRLRASRHASMPQAPKAKAKTVVAASRAEALQTYRFHFMKDHYNEMRYERSLAQTVAQPGSLVEGSVRVNGLEVARLSNSTLMAGLPDLERQYLMVHCRPVGGMCFFPVMAWYESNQPVAVLCTHWRRGLQFGIDGSPPVGELKMGGRIVCGIDAQGVHKRVMTCATAEADVPNWREFGVEPTEKPVMYVQLHRGHLGRSVRYVVFLTPSCHTWPTAYQMACLDRRLPSFQCHTAGCYNKRDLSVYLYVINQLVAGCKGSPDPHVYVNRSRQPDGISIISRPFPQLVRFSRGLCAGLVDAKWCLAGEGEEDTTLPCKGYHMFNVRGGTWLEDAPIVDVQLPGGDEGQYSMPIMRKKESPVQAKRAASLARVMSGLPCWRNDAPRTMPSSSLRELRDI